ncbi:MAG: ATP-binding cassette domain-containing protein, partial [Thermoleophilia bacterium]|nr:ATP-binding cassette domain-containing protein [Thermoleophilia bacterium]
MRATTISEREQLEQASETLARLEHEFTGESLFAEGSPGRAVVSARAVSRTYGKGDAAVHALRDVDIDITEGRLTAIMGPSGSGKSTLIHILAGLDQPTGGRISIDGVEITRLKEKKLTQLRRDKIGFIFQSFNLLATLTADENIVLPLSLARRHADEAWQRTVIEAIGISDRLSHRPSELSGGQQQRVAVA